MEYIITCQEGKHYDETGEMSQSIKMAWEHFTRKLTEGLRVEAQKKGFKLASHEVNFSSSISRNVMFDIPNASPELQEVTRELQFVIICMKD